MTSQSEYEKNKAAAEKADAQAKNARALQKKKDDANKKIKQLKGEIAGIQHFEIKYKQDAIKKYEENVAAKQKAYNIQYKSRLPHDAGDLNALLNDPYYGSKSIDSFKSAIAEWNADIKVSAAKIKKIEAQIKEQEKIAFKMYFTPLKPGVIVPPVKKPIVKKPPVTNDTSTGGIVDNKFSIGYKFNAPMVSNAYFGKGIQADSVANSPFTTIKPDQFAYYNAYAQQAFQDSLLTTGALDLPDPGIGSIDVPLFQDAADTWKNTRGGRGVLQMDRVYTQSVVSGKKGDLTYANAPNATFDRQLYGFKFLYNPTTVSMAWDVNDTMDPPYLASGKDKFNLISTGLMSSTVGFELLLNRIDDLNHLNEWGEVRGDVNPYPINVPIEDRKELFKKGTMYDLEYLFKAINGPDATFTSLLNGDTADRGWLRPTILELHLGQSMRYRVRVAALSVNHIIFSKEMVPTLSKVMITVKRMIDQGNPKED
jgi:hypothetical protein